MRNRERDLANDKTIDADFSEVDEEEIARIDEVQEIRKRKPVFTRIYISLLVIISLAAIIFAAQRDYMALGSLFIYSLLFFATVYLIEYERKRSREKLLLLKYGILNPLSLTGVQFEKACGDVLSARGYMVEYTKASGDYGIDVIARKNGLAVGIQCKRHTAKVGVKAVQEVHSGTMYYGLDRSCVISIAGFTKNSMTLASKLNVDLITAKEILVHNFL